MMVKAKTTSWQDVEVDNKDALDELVNRVLIKARLPRGVWISKSTGDMMVEEDCGPHRPTDKNLGRPTDEQRKVIEAVETLTKLVEEACKL